MKKWILSLIVIQAGSAVDMLRIHLNTDAPKMIKIGKKQNEFRD